MSQASVVSGNSGISGMGPASVRGACGFVPASHPVYVPKSPCCECEKKKKLGQQAKEALVAWRTQRKAVLRKWVAEVVRHIGNEVLSAARRGTAVCTFDMSDLWCDVHIGCVTNDPTQMVPPSYGEWQCIDDGAWLHFGDNTLIDFGDDTLIDFFDTELSAEYLIAKMSISHGDQVSTTLPDLHDAEIVVPYELKLVVKCMRSSE